MLSPIAGTRPSESETGEGRDNFMGLVSSEAASAWPVHGAFDGGLAEASLHEAVLPEWGHRVSSLQDTGKLVIYSEPLFYAFTLQAPSGPDPDTIMLRGWHNKRMTDNVTFTDGSARSITVGDRPEIEASAATRMHVFTVLPQYYVLRRGRHWRMDCYPVTGAWIRFKDGNGGWIMPELPGNYNGQGWPTDGVQQNIVDPEY